MSSKKDKFTLKDKNYMKLALNLASARKGLTGDNPSVGCLIVKNDKVISIGQTGLEGRPHAEHNAINNSSENPSGSSNQSPSTDSSSASDSSDKGSAR